MTKFAAIKAFGGPGRRQEWTIEETTPGEKPVQLDFLGNEKEATDEARRLNIYGHRQTEQRKTAL